MEEWTHRGNEEIREKRMIVKYMYSACTCMTRELK